MHGIKCHVLITSFIIVDLTHRGEYTIAGSNNQDVLLTHAFLLTGILARLLDYHIIQCLCQSVANVKKPMPIASPMVCNSNFSILKKSIRTR